MTEEQEALLGKALAGELSREEFYGLSALLEEFPKEGENHLRNQRVGDILRLLLEGKDGRAPFSSALAVRARTNLDRSVFIKTTRRRAEAAHRKRVLTWGAALAAATLVAVIILSRRTLASPLALLQSEGPIQVIGADRTPQPLEPHQSLGGVERIRTGPRAGLQLGYPDGTEIHLDAETELAIGDAESRHLELTRGSLEVRAPSFVPGRALGIRTPQATVEASGVRFVLAAGPAVTFLEVSQGRARLSDPPGNSVQVAAGSYSIVAPGAPLLTRRGIVTSSSLLSAISSGATVTLPAPAQPIHDHLENGSMTDGTEVPSRWEGRWIGKGMIQVHRDTTTFKSAPASLRIENAGGPAVGEVYQVLSGTGGASFGLEGYLKTDGQAKVTVAVQCFDPSWKQLDFRQLKFVQNETDWTPWKGQVVLPERTAWYYVLVLVDGEGKAWIDDVVETGGR